MRENRRADSTIAALPQSDSTAAKQMKIISTGSNRKSCCKSVTKPFANQHVDLQLMFVF
jgi:hypothetical protein